MNKRNTQRVADGLQPLKDMTAIVAGSLQLGDRFVWLNNGKAYWACATLITYVDPECEKILVSPADHTGALRIDWDDVVYLVSKKVTDYHESEG